MFRLSLSFGNLTFKDIINPIDEYNIIESGIEYNIQVAEDGATWWFYKDNIHRENGPAVVEGDGNKSWFLNGALVYNDSNDNTYKFDLTEKMKLSIIKYKLSI